MGTIVELPPGPVGPVRGDGAAPASAGSPGHIDAAVVGRFPTGYQAHPIDDNIVFTGDVSAGILIQVSGAELYDKWRWRSWRPGGSLAGDCYMQIVPPGAPGNTSGFVALVQNCSLPWLITTGYTYPSGCPCAFGFIGGAFRIAGTSSVNYQGTWAGVIDYTDPAGNITPGVVIEDIYLVKTPLVAVLHGFALGCDGIGSLRQNLVSQLEIADNRVRCRDYAWAEGIEAGAQGMGEWIRRFVAEVDPTQSEVDIVAYSQGGLVARYYYRYLWSGSTDPAIGSIAMLGTPNEGVYLTKFVRWSCPRWARVVPRVNEVCLVIDIAGLVIGGIIDLNWPVIEDFKPDSQVLRDLNNGFALPVSPIYRAHVGDHTTWLGTLLSGKGGNDCFISWDSTFGKGDVFGDRSIYRAFKYPGVSHAGGFPFCDGSNTLTNNRAVVQNLLPDIKRLFGFPGGLDAPAVAPLVSSTTLEPDTPALRLIPDGVNQGGSNTHTVSVPAGVSNATFAVLWAGGEEPADLSVRVLRPGGAEVSPSDADVLETLSLDGTEDSFLLTGKGFAIAGPGAGDWTVEVTGTTVGVDGEPYIAGMFPESQVALSATTSANVVLSGGAQVAMAQVLDTDTPIPATITATVFAVDGTQQDITLLDDGTQGDAVAGDNLYSRTIPTTGSCGTVRLLVSADAAASSEGPVHREQLASFDVNVPGDAVRDPCSADDDGDGLTDVDEYDVYATSPVNFDTDVDGLTDGDEVNVYGTDPLVADTDVDGLPDGDEVNVYGTDPLVADTDGDALPDGDEVNTYGTDPLVVDTDGDALPDGDEVNTYGTDPLVADTDGDGCKDGKEVSATFAVVDPLDPWDFYSVPVPALFAAPDPTVVFKDGFVAASDSQAVWGYFRQGPRVGTTVYDQDLNLNGIADGVEYDRTVTGTGTQSGPPDGVISASEAQLAYVQFKARYSC